jgi:hypothetical protein
MFLIGNIFSVFVNFCKYALKTSCSIFASHKKQAILQLKSNKNESSAMDSLKAADMPAVLARTNLKPNEENALLPIYESVSNAIYSAQERWKEQVASQGKILLEMTTANFSARISDNGHGLDDRNYDNFRVPFTSSRLKKGGKGFGRFIAFKVFETITYHSVYANDNASVNRSFDFNIYAEKEFQPASKALNLEFETGCVVYYQNPLEEFRNIYSQMEAEEIIERVIRYFLPFYLSGSMPDFQIKIDGADFDTREHFREFFKPQVTVDKKIPIGDEEHEFKLDIAKVSKNRLFNDHIMLLFADGRIIGSGRKIEGKIGVPHFQNENGERQIYVATVSGKFLDDRANTARTQIEADEKEIDAIVNVVGAQILELEKEFVTKHRKKQTGDVQSAILRNPLLRSGLKDSSIGDYVASQPMNWKTENFVGDLALKRYRGQQNWEKIFEEGLKTPEKLKGMREELLKNIDQENKNALASYVSHRKSVLELAEKILGYQDDGKMSLEDMFHDLVHPRYEDSETTEFFQHNLWMIDEKLSFFSYCSSDRTIHGGRRQAGDKVADLIFFDDCSVYQDGDSDSIVLVEFKRPGRDDYKYGDVKQDPIEQVKATAIKIRDEQRIITKTGRTISVPVGVRLYAYIVADLEPSLTKACQNHDMQKTWDDKGYYMYHKTNDIFIETVGYDKLISDAQKRNAAFFDILLGDIVS